MRSLQFTFALLLSLGPATVAAKVVLPNGTTIPTPDVYCQDGQPGGLKAVFACACTDVGVCNIGAPCPGGSASCDQGANGTCEARIWHEENDNSCIPSHHQGLDPVNDAAVKPETFKPVCGHTFTLLTRGGAMFKNAFGWYNVTPGQKPPASDLHVLIDCNTADGTRTDFDLMSKPEYKGGEIGFFLVTPEDHAQGGTCAGGDCCATIARAVAGQGRVYYSEPQYNPDTDYVHLLIYNSKIDPHMFYFGWEDTFEGHTTDYSDFVTSVSGISCAGGGEQCDTLKSGVCGLGVTKCDIEGNLICEESIKASPERCDGLDNDCNGKVDDGASCEDGKQCYQGACVGDCTASLEFPCQSGFACDEATGFCVESACKGVVCNEGEICRGGDCGSGCEGVTCPPKQICSGGLCVDLCAGVGCGGNEVCLLGVCVPNCASCGGLTCGRDEACDTQSGECYDPSCSASCGPGTYCKAGNCVDTCAEVVCPGGAACVDGRCPPPGIGSTSPGGDGGVGSDANVPWRFDGGGVNPPGGDGADRPFYVKDSGCALGGGADEGRGAALIGLLLLGLFAGRRRR